jgi:carotenoid cleavage dioxygenase
MSTQAAHAIRASFAEVAHHPAFQSNLAPVSEEVDNLPAELISGTLPPEVAGTLLRIGPNPQFVPSDPASHHWFLGDGMVHALRIGAGECRYSNRWVRTAKWQHENAAGRVLYGGWGYRPLDGGPPADLDGTANTNLVYHGGRLLALQESSPPIVVDPGDLATIGRELFDGRLGRTFTAHPKLDVTTGELVAHGVQSAGFGSEEAHYYVLDAAGELVRSETFRLPFAAYVHDFLITATQVIFPLSPLVADRDRARQGQPYIWRGDRPALVGIFDRAAGPASVRWIETSAFYVFHVFNAYDGPGGSIVADVLEYTRPPLFPDETGRVPTNAEINSAVVRWTITTGAAPSITREHVCPSPAYSLEFPTIDERCSTLPHRIGYFVGRENGDRLGFNTLARVDFASGAVTSRRYGPHDMLSEPLFVPRGPGAAPDDGWLAFLLYRDETRSSELHLQDSTNLTAEATTVFALPRRVPQGFHGAWIPAK